MNKFVTAVNCMDGRVQEPVVAFMKKQFGATYVDMITEPGPDGILSEKKNEKLIESVRDRIAISVEKHGSGIIGMFGHGDCAGNPVDKNKHIVQTMDSVNLIRSWFPDVKVFGYWIDEDWKVVEIK
ncbi:MAG: hypothetical protein JXA03_01785 [Bacteroidales bacterium]|nr:hypothetical protein [Bacteroidales bacterium]